VKSCHPGRFKQRFSIISGFLQVDREPNSLTCRYGVQTVILFGLTPPENYGCLDFVEHSPKIRMIALGTRQSPASWTDWLRFIEVIEFEPALPATHNFTPHSV
jgi:hypothetical protein